MEEQKEEKFDEQQPVFKRVITLSRDRKWVMIRTIRKDIIHVNYLNKILGNTAKPKPAPVKEETVSDNGGNNGQNKV